MTSAAPTILTLETDSTWVLILVVSLVTLPATLLLRRLIGRPGGVASGLLLSLPLLLPLVVAVVYQGSLLPELAVLRPAREVFSAGSNELMHMLYFLDGGRVTPYVAFGSQGPWIMLVGLSVSSFMLLRRALGTYLVHRLITRCQVPQGWDARRLSAIVVRLCEIAGLKRPPQVLLLPAGVSGAFAVGMRRPKILISTNLLDRLDEDELEAILAHEIAHIEARDIPVIFTSGLMRDMVAWNPFAHLAFRKLHQDREFEADRRAATMTGKPLAVASGLLKMCEMVGKRRHGRQAALAFFRPGGRVARRVTKLLAVADGRIAMSRESALPYLMAALMVATLGLQAGAKIANDSSGFAISWGTADSSTAVYAPKQHGKGPRVLPESTQRAEFESPQRHLGAHKAASVNQTDMEAWLEDMSRWAARKGAQGLSPVTVAWEARQDWRVVPLRCPVGSFCIYRVDKQGP